MGRLFVESDGLQISVEIVGQGRPLLYAHGLTGNRRHTLRQLAVLSERHQVITFDQRGHGDTTPITDPAQFDVARMAADIGVVLDALDIEKAIIGGESMGARTSLLFALKKPSRVEALLLTAPPFRKSWNPELEQLRQMGLAIAEKGLEPVLVQIATRRREMGMPEDVISYLADLYRSHDPDSLALAIQTGLSWAETDDLATSATLGTPTCIIAIENDPLHPLETAQYLARTIPDARLETLPSVLALFAPRGEVGRIYSHFLDAR